MNKKTDYLACLSYLGPLFIIPLIKKESEFSIFHAKQGAVLFAFWVVIRVLQWLNGLLFNNAITLFVFISLNYVFSVLGILVLTFSVWGIMNVLRGAERKLPILGKIKLFH